MIPAQFAWQHAQLRTPYGLHCRAHQRTATILREPHGNQRASTKKLLSPLQTWYTNLAHWCPNLCKVLRLHSLAIAFADILAFGLHFTKPLQLWVTHHHRSPFRRGQNRIMDGAVIVPLYVYPSMGAWDPVYDMYEPLPSLISIPSILV